MQVTLRDNNNEAIVLNTVREAKKRAFAADGMHDLQPIAGHQGFIQKAVELAYGRDAACIREGRVAAVQTVSGTGVLLEGPSRAGCNLLVLSPKKTQHFCK